MSIEITPVLVVGGSLVGLSTALFLAFHEVPCVLVEPHLASHPHPRAVGFTTRTLELLHLVGIELPAIPAGFSLKRARVESLVGTWHEERAWTPRAQPMAEYSPFRGAAIAQDKLEPILRDEAKGRGADIRLGTELVRFEQDDDGVTAHLRDQSGRVSRMRASYMVACDGNASPVREALDISRKGPGLLETMRSVLFKAPLESYLEKGVHQFEIDQPDLQAFLTTYGDGRWVLMFKDDLERDEAALRLAINKAIGKDDVPIEIITSGRWDLTALVATRFSKGRVFLAGDAAHTLPPTRGGYGANTGIHDAHNLAWKLKDVLTGRSDPSLLDTYDAERRPAAWTRLEQTFVRPDYAKHARGFANCVAILDEAGIELGQLYRTLATDPALPEAKRPDEWRGEPGTRAPHVKLEDGSSTLDWFGRGWVLVAANDAWRAEPGVVIVRVPESVREAFGLTSTGAALIRPDGYIAWRKNAP